MANWIATRDYTDYDGEYHGEVANFLICDVPEEIDLTVDKIKGMWRSAYPKMTEYRVAEVFAELENGWIHRVDNAISNSLAANLLRFDIDGFQVLFWDEDHSLPKIDVACAALKAFAHQLLDGKMKG